MSGDLSSSLRQLASPLIHPAPFVRVSANMRKRRTCVLVADFIKGLRLKICFDTTIGLVLLHLHLLPSTRGSRGCRKASLHIQRRISDLAQYSGGFIGCCEFERCNPAAKIMLISSITADIACAANAPGGLVPSAGKSVAFARRLAIILKHRQLRQHLTYLKRTSAPECHLLGPGMKGRSKKASKD